MTNLSFSFPESLHHRDASTSAFQRLPREKTTGLFTGSGEVTLRRCGAGPPSDWRCPQRTSPVTVRQTLSLLPVPSQGQRPQRQPLRQRDRLDASVRRQGASHQQTQPRHRETQPGGGD